MNMFQGGTWIFAAPIPAVVGTDFTTDMKHAIITENYGVQKSIVVLYPMKHLHTCVKLAVVCYIMTVQNVVYVLCIHLYNLSKKVKLVLKQPVYIQFVRVLL
jgi:hypothetical protein